MSIPQVLQAKERASESEGKKASGPGGTRTTKICLQTLELKKGHCPSHWAAGPVAFGKSATKETKLKPPINKDAELSVVRTTGAAPRSQAPPAPPPSLQVAAPAPAPAPVAPAAPKAEAPGAGWDS